MQRLERVGPHEWRFRWPEGFFAASEAMDAAVDLAEAGNEREAERRLRALLASHPEHLDVQHYLALVLDRNGREEEALRLWQEAVALGRTAFPPRAFKRGNDLLEWGWLENRPFLRCLDGLLLAYRDAGRDVEAIELGRELLVLNPNDNQGIRCVLPAVLLDGERYAEVVDLLAPYRDDMFAETLYCRALALFALSRFDEADDALRDAIERLPLVAEELLRADHVPVEGPMPGHQTIGGADQAYNYWEECADDWEAILGSLKWLKRVRDNLRLAEGV